MNVVHEETQRFNLFIIMLIAFTAVVIGAYFISSWHQHDSMKISGSSAYVLAALLVFDLFFIANFFQLKTVVSDQQLIFGFGIMKKKINLTSIEIVRVEDYVFHKYMGYGIRVSRDRTIGYIASSGQGVFIKTPTKNYFITSSGAERLKSMIESAKHKSAAAG
ncbi:MAG: hypothetical protein ACOZBH_05620 [Patescibacteria group bacterium]